MHINDDPFRADIDERAVREVLKELLDILEPRHPRLSFAQRVAEICMLLELEVNLTEGPLNNPAGIYGITNLSFDEIDDRLKAISAHHSKKISS